MPFPRSPADGFLIPVLTALLLSLSCGMCAPCADPGSDQERIRQMVERAARLAEGHDIGGLMELATEDLVVMPGARKPPEVRRLLFVLFRRYREFSLHFPRPDVELDAQGRRASVGIVVLLVRKGQQVPELAEIADRPDRWLQEVSGLADLFSMKLGLVSRDGEWLVERARVERFRGIVPGS